MTNAMLISRGHETQQAGRLVLAAIVLLPIFGIVWADSISSFIGYMAVTAMALAPSILWLRMGGPGIPVFPVVAAVHFIYFAIPILRHNVGREIYDVSAAFEAATTVSIFLIAATAGWWVSLGRSVRNFRQRVAAERVGPRVIFVVFGGLAIGLIFQTLLLLGALTEFGSYFGLIRSVALTAVAISSYLLGHCRGRGMIHGMTWHLALATMTGVIFLSWSSLLLVAGMTYAMAAVLGYAITTKRVPWKMLVPAAAIVFVLHAGKAEMRHRYWNANYAGTTSIGDVPELLGEWFSLGIEAIENDQSKQDIVDRASLMHILLRVQRLTPKEIPYLDGETYALLPEYLVPRFINPDKIASQAGLEMLNIRYGIQSSVTSKTTTIGWGVISEGFANFGLAGVIGIGVIYGALAGLFTRMSAGKSPLAMKTLLSVAALVIMINLEADFGYLVTNLFQALVAAAVFFLPLRMLSNANVENARARAPVPVPQRYRS